MKSLVAVDQAVLPIVGWMRMQRCGRQWASRVDLALGQQGEQDSIWDAAAPLPPFSRAFVVTRVVKTGS